ncbi:MAG: gamma-glutamyltransferase [Bacteroidales bacterium]|nr:gamma-glutamyltransferase [Bacteroidales bacterium]
MKTLLRPANLQFKIKERQNMHYLILKLKEYKAVFREALTTEYKGYRIISVPPPSSGGITLFQLLKMVEPYPLKEWGFHSVKSIHLIAEAEKRAFADRAEFAGDPDFVDVPVDGLLNNDYLTGKLNSFSENRASLSSEISAGSPEGYVSEETTHYSVTDESGNAVAATTTLNNTFGSSIVVDGAGFLLNNQMDDFSVKPGFPNLYGLIGGEANSIKSGKRMLSSMTPTIVEKNGRLFIVLGSPGGSTIPTTVFQVIVNVIDFRMKIGEAVDAGRFHHQWLPDWIMFERDGIDSLTVNTLKQMGHEMKQRISIGRVNAIQILEDGQKTGSADKRGDNSSCGY